MSSIQRKQGVEEVSHLLNYLISFLHLTSLDKTTGTHLSLPPTRIDPVSWLSAWQVMHSHLTFDSGKTGKHFSQHKNIYTQQKESTVSLPITTNTTANKHHMRLKQSTSLTKRMHRVICRSERTESARHAIRLQREAQQQNFKPSRVISKRHNSRENSWQRKQQRMQRILAKHTHTRRSDVLTCRFGCTGGKIG